MDRPTWWRCCGCCGGTCGAWICRGWLLRGVICKVSRCKMRRCAGTLLQECVFTRELRCHQRGRHQPQRTDTGPPPASGEKCGCGARKGRPAPGLAGAHRHSWGLAFSPDERLASGSLDGSVKLWDVESGALLWSGWHTWAIVCLAFAPDGGLHLPAAISRQPASASGGSRTAGLLPASALGPEAGHSPLRRCRIPGRLRAGLEPGWTSACQWRLAGHDSAVGDRAGPTATCVQTLAGHSNWCGDWPLPPTVAGWPA